MSDQHARKTDRPPPADAITKSGRTRTASPGRYGPPQATTKIRPFELAEALARSSADDDEVAPTTAPREDDAPFVHGEVEVVGVEEIAGVAHDFEEPPRESGELPIAAAQLAVTPRPPSRLGLVLLGLVVGLLAMAYVYVRVNH